MSVDDFGSWDAPDTKWCNSCEDHCALVDCEIAGLCPVCGAETTIEGQTTDGRVYTACHDAFPIERWIDNR